MINSKEQKKQPLTKEEKAKNRVNLEKSLLADNLPMFQMLGLKDPHFYPKVPYAKSGQMVISVFERELISPNGFFTEMVDEDYVGPHIPRKLYRWKGNAHHKTEFQKINTGTGDRWLLPVDELEVINPDDFVPKITSKPEELVKIEYTSPTKEEDIKNGPMSSLTVLDYCAINWKKPVAEKEYINDLIRKTFNV